MVNRVKLVPGFESQSLRDFANKAHLLRCSVVRLCDAILIASPRSLLRVSYLGLIRKITGFEEDSK